MQSSIFISYRRDDSGGEAGRLHDELARAFGAASVFMDVAGIVPGTDFRKAIDDNVSGCGVFLALIGPQWATITGATGEPRLKDPNDFVRLEIASALARNIAVIPVLVRGTRMPRPEQLPENIRELAYRHSIEISHARWNSDVLLLIDALKQQVPTPPKSDEAIRATAGPVSHLAFGPVAAAKDGRKLALIVGASVVALALAVGGGIFAARGGFAPATTERPLLQSVQAKPNSVQKGGRITLTVLLDRPAPNGGALVVLTSSDPAILTVDGNVIVPQGRTMGTGYSTAVDVPAYASPVAIAASYNNATVQTDVNVAAPPSIIKDHVSRPSATNVGRANNLATANQPAASSVPSNLPAASPVVSKPPPLDAELIGRFEDAQGRLAAEKAFWENTKAHMPAGTSLRPEITSQLYAAESAGQRCAREKESLDAASLGPCIDSLNDHLTQLHLQH